MPSKAHGYALANLTITLPRYRGRYTMFSELTLELDGREIVSDLSVYPKTHFDLINDEGRVTAPLLLAVEIATDTQNTQDLVEFLLDVGV